MSLQTHFTARVWVLVPAFNEELHIQRCIEETREAFPGAHILVIDNGSSDRTAAIAEHTGVEVLYEMQKGKGFAVTAGVRHALAQGADWIALHDADCEYSATHLAQLVRQCLAEAGGDLGRQVMGVGLREVMLGHVLWRSLVANFVARLALRLALHSRPPADILTGARVMSGTLARALFQVDGKQFRGFELETALTRGAMKLGAGIVTQRVRYVPRVATEKKIKASDMFGILAAAFKG